MFELRPYQIEAVEAVENEWRNGVKNTLLVQATGCGKTICLSRIARDVVDEGGRVLVLAHRGELLDQAADKFERAAGLMTAREQANQHSMGSLFPVTVGSVQTLMKQKRLDEFPREYFTHIFVDEAHHSVANSYMRILDHFSSAKVLGVTATADRADKKGLSKVYETLAYEYGLKQAIEEGYLSPIKAQMIPLNIDISQVKVHNGDFDSQQLGNALEPYLDAIADEMRTYCKGRRTVVFLPLVKMAKDFAELLNSKGFRACEIDGNSPNRAELLQGFESGRYDVVTNAMLLCLDDKTEILTSRGFVGKDDIREDDLVANWNFDGSVFFERPHEIVRRPLYDCEHMTSIESRTINLRVTNTHRMIVDSGARNGTWKKIPASDLRSGHILPACGVAEPLDVEMPTPPYERLTHIRVESGELAYTHPSELTLDECRFIGFFLAEGTVTHLQSGGIEYKVSQVRNLNPAIVRWFDAVVESTGFNCVIKEKLRRRISGTNPLEGFVKYWSFCRGTGHGSQSRNGLFRIEPYLNHDGTDLFWGLNESQFDALIEGFWYGDGFHGRAEDGMPRSIELCGCYGKLFDLWSAIGSVRGWRCAIHERPQKNPRHNMQYHMRMIKGGNLHISCKTPIIQEDRGPEEVWCVRTTSRNIITRRNGRVTVMGNTEGWDCPPTDCIICLRPTKSRSLYCQCVGRGTRLYPGKDHLLLLDFLWMSERHNLCRPASLLGANEDVEEKVAKEIAKGIPIDLLDAEEQAKTDVVAERESALAAQLEEMKHRKKKLVDPLQYAVSIGDYDLQSHEDVFAWQKAEATEKQIRFLEARGIDASAMPLTKGMASKLIDAIVERQSEGLATPKQVRFLESKGFMHCGQWSFEDASAMITQISNNRWRVPFHINPSTYVPRSMVA